MRTTMIAGLTVLMAVAATPAYAQWSGLGGGLLANITGEDVDNGYGLYVGADYSFNDYVFFRTAINHMVGDLTVKGIPESRTTTEGVEVETTRDVDSGYDRTGLEFSVNVRTRIENMEPYAGLGAGYYLNELDEDFDVDDKLGRFIQGGVVVELNPRLKLDGMIRFLQLKPDGPQFVEVDMDSFQIGAGLVYSFR